MPYQQVRLSLDWRHMKNGWLNLWAQSLSINAGLSWRSAPDIAGGDMSLTVQKGGSTAFQTVPSGVWLTNIGHRLKAKRTAQSQSLPNDKSGCRRSAERGFPPLMKSSHLHLPEPASSDPKARVRRSYAIPLPASLWCAEGISGITADTGSQHDHDDHAIRTLCPWPSWRGYQIQSFR